MSPWDGVKIAVLLFVAAVMQVSVFSQTDVFGAAPDLLLVTLVAVSLLRGAVAGALGGFFAGLIVDTASLGTLGLTSLVLTLAGFWIGRYGDTTGRDRAHAPYLSIAVVTVFYRLGSSSSTSFSARALPREPSFASLLPAVFSTSSLPARSTSSCDGSSDRSGPLSSAPRLNFLASTAAGGPRGRARDGADAERESAVEPYRLTPKLARRLAILGALLLVGFAALVMRLWTLQVLAGAEYAARASANHLRPIPVRAARGPIVDRNGDPLVTSVAVTSVDLYPSALPKSGDARHRELEELSRITHVPVLTILRGIGQLEDANDMIDPFVIRPEAPKKLVTYLRERANLFPGVSLGQTYVRRYPHGDLAAQLFGVVGQISPGELQTLASQGFQSGDETGKSGIEYAFNNYLHGIDGAARVRVDSSGQRLSQRALVTPAQPGDTVRLTLDTGLQLAAQNALAYGIQLAHGTGDWAADGGAIVAMDPQTGAILAAASSPSYDPALYTGRQPSASWQRRASRTRTASPTTFHF